MNKLTQIIGGVAPVIASALGGPLAGAAVGFLAKHFLGNPDASQEDVETALLGATPAQLIELKTLDLQFKERMALIQLQTNQLINQQLEAQSTTNQVEASDPNLFKSGWRPAIGWICGCVLFNNFLIAPYFAAMGISIPILDAGQLMPILLGLLGLGTLRTFEKIKQI